jgi:outer membrane immunogenic protein
MKYPVLIAGVLAALAGPAYAQDLSGVRIEGRVGWEQVGAGATLPNPDFDEDDADIPEFLTGSENDVGITYGAEIGYDLQVGPGLVIGAYAGADFSDSRMCTELVEDDLACADLGRTFTLGARAGVPFGRSSLVYVKGGYSNGKFDIAYDPDVTDNDAEEPGAIAQFSNSRGGFHVGGGVELGLTQGLYGKFEYVYTDYGKGSYLLGDEEGDPTLAVGADRHQALVGIGLRF